MNEDIKRLLDETAGNEPLTAYDPDAAVKRGHGALTRRRMTVGGLTTGVVAIVAAAMVALPGIMAPAKGEDPTLPGGGNAAESSAPGALPELDPELYYTWEYGNYEDGVSNWIEIIPEYTESTAKYDDAFKAVLDDRFGGFDGDARIGSVDTKLMSKPSLDADGNTAIADERTVYHLRTGIVNGETGDGLKQWGKNKGDYEGLSVDVHAPGDFTLGTDGPVASDALKGDRGVYDLANCEDYADRIQAGQTREVTVDCDERTTAKNERIIEVTEVGAPGTAYEMTNRFLVLYRVDGSAVVVGDFAGEPEQELSFDFEDLTAIAVALPLEPIS